MIQNKLIIILITFAISNITIVNGQIIYKDISKSKDAIVNSNYDKLFKGNENNDYSFGYTTDGKYGVENIYYYVNEYGFVYKVVYVPEDAIYAYRRYSELVKNISLEDFKSIDIPNYSVYAKKTPYYDGSALFKYGKKHINNDYVHCFTIILDRTP